MIGNFKKSALYFIPVAALSMLLGACSTSRLVSSWSEPNNQEKLSKVLVLGMAKNESVKRVYETTMVKALRDAGADAQEAGTMIPAGTEENREAIEAAIADKGFDSVLVTRMVSKREETYFVPDRPYSVPQPYYNGFYDYYMRTYPTVYSPGYLVNDTIVSLETNIYQVKDAKLIWAVVSESLNPSDINKEVESLSELFIKQLKKDGLLASKN